MIKYYMSESGFKDGLGFARIDTIQKTPNKITVTADTEENARITANRIIKTLNK